MNVSQILKAPQVPERRQSFVNKTDYFFTESQAEALVRLHRLADVFVAADGISFGGISTRTKPLILGGTGTGKTCIARRFAEARGWSFLSIDCSAWIVLGSSKPSTLSTLRDYIRKQEKGEHRRGAILLDELDKLLPTGSAALRTGWTTSVFGECLSCLDSDERLFAHGWTADDLEGLKSKYLIIGAGAFEFFLREAKQQARGGSLGFSGADKKPMSFGQFLADSQAIPDEIASRFAAPPIFIESPTQDDFKEAIQQIHDDLNIPSDRSVDEIAAEAESSLGGMRFCENYLTGLLIDHPEASRRKADNSEMAQKKSRRAEADGSFDFFSPDTTQHVRLLNDDIFTLSVVLSKVLSAIPIAIEEGRIKTTPGDPLWLYLSDQESITEHAFRALCALELCAEASPDMSKHSPVFEWALRIFKGIRDYSPQLAKAGLLTLWHECWDFTNRVNQRRIRLSTCVAHGRYRA